MKYETPLKKATFHQRLNRFAVLVRVGRCNEMVHLPNSGRLNELLVAGRTVFLIERPQLNRKTACDIVLTSLGGYFISLDARLPNELVAEALSLGILPPLKAIPVFEER